MLFGTSALQHFGISALRSCHRRQSSRAEDAPGGVYRMLGAHTGLSTAGVRRRTQLDEAQARSGAHTLAEDSRQINEITASTRNSQSAGNRFPATHIALIYALWGKIVSRSAAMSATAPCFAPSDAPRKSGWAADEAGLQAQIVLTRQRCELADGVVAAAIRAIRQETLPRRQAEPRHVPVAAKEGRPLLPAN